MLQILKEIFCRHQYDEYSRYSVDSAYIGLQCKKCRRILGVYVDLPDEDEQDQQKRKFIQMLKESLD
jgi:hypothetical protein